MYNVNRKDYITYYYYKGGKVIARRVASGPLELTEDNGATYAPQQGTKASDSELDYGSTERVVDDEAYRAALDKAMREHNKKRVDFIERVTNEYDVPVGVVEYFLRYKNGYDWAEAEIGELVGLIDEYK